MMAHISDPKTNDVVLKRLGYFSTATTKKMVAIVGRMYTFGKANTGPFRHPMNAVERRVGPLYLKMENIACQIDKRVDETHVKSCKNAHQQLNETIYQVEETAPREAKSFDVEETKNKFSKTKPLNAHIEATESEPYNTRCDPAEEERWFSKAWHKLLQHLLTPQVIEACVYFARMLKKIGITEFDSAAHIPVEIIRNLFCQIMTAWGHKDLVDKIKIYLNEDLLRKLCKAFSGFLWLPCKGKKVFRKTCFSFFGFVDFGCTITLRFPFTFLFRAFYGRCQTVSF